MKFTARINEDGTVKMAVVGYMNKRKFACIIDPVDPQLPVKERIAFLETNARLAVNEVLNAQGRRSVQEIAT